MSHFIPKQAIETKPSVGSKRKRSRRSKADYNPSPKRRCRVEELEKREYLAADPISVGVVYTEQYMETEGDIFTVAWVGGEDGGATTLDSLIINLDKNQNGRLDTGEAIFDTEGADGVYSYVPFQLVSKSDEIGYDYQVEDGGQVLTITFTNFHEGDSFIFKIDLDEYQPSATNSDPKTSTNSAQVEGAEMGGSLENYGDLAGSYMTTTFTSTHYQTSAETAMFVDQFDNEYDRANFPELDNAYNDVQFPADIVYKDASDKVGDEGIARAGVLAKYDLTPKPIVISGYVYADHDVDCNYEPQDQDVPLSNVEVTLYDVDGAKVGVTKTDVNGYYEFSDSSLMPGKYQIISQSDVVSPSGDHYVDFCAKGGTFGTKINPLEIDVDGMQGGDVADNNNFAKVLPATISGHVFEDFNDNGVKDAGESWDEVVNPVTVELYRIVTNEDGSKKYVFMESQQVGADGYYQFDFDCSYGPDGEYRKLPGRTYEIREYQPSAYTDGKDHIGSLGGVQTQKGDVDVVSEIFVGYGQNGVNYDFGELKLGSISGNVYEDRNDNAVLDRGEPAIAGVTVNLYQWNGSSYEFLASTETNQEGYYYFGDLDISCKYAIEEVQPDGYSQGKINAVGSLGGKAQRDYFSEVEVGWNEHGYDYNFGELKLGQIAGNVFEDRNDNGVFDSGEAGIAGVDIDLYRWNGSNYEYVKSTKTDSKGAYLFAELDINEEYAVKEHQPDEYDDGKDHIGTLGGNILAYDSVNKIDEMRDIYVQWDDKGEKYDFGELKLASISGYVYHDRNDNGNYDDDENPIADVTVDLYALEDGEYKYVRSTKTNGAGFYSFDGLDINKTYAVKEHQPVDWNDGKDSIGTLGGTVLPFDPVNNIDEMNDIYAEWGDRGEEYNFGELAPVGSLSGYVYEDNNDNGLKEVGEAGIKDVTVQLYKVDPETGLAILVGTQTTDSNGYYKFSDLEPRLTYLVHEVQPTEYYDGKDAVGTIFGTVVGRQVKNDEIEQIYLPNNGDGVNYNFGELKPASLSGFVYYDQNKNGLKDLGEPGIPNTTVTLWKLDAATGTYKETGRVVKTDGAGHYIFDNLQPSQVYRIVETQPKGYKDGAESLGTLGGNVGADEFYNVNVAPGDVGEQYNFGEIRDLDPPPYIPPTPAKVPLNTWSAAPTYFSYVFNQPYNPGSMTTLYGGGGGFADPHVWRLSSLDSASLKSESTVAWQDGFRGDRSLLASVEPDMWFHNGNGNWADVSSKASGGTSKWIYFNDLKIRGQIDDGSLKEFGKAGTPIVGDWAGKGKDSLGIFADGSWYLDANGDGVWDGDDILARLGDGSTDPVAGDWDGDGKTDIGVYGPKLDSDQPFIVAEKGMPADLKVYQTVVDESLKKKISENGAFNEKAMGKPHVDDMQIRGVRSGRNGQVRYDLVDHVFENGSSLDTPITGDWTGEGIARIGRVRGNRIYLDYNGDGKFDSNEEYVFHFDENLAAEKYIPVVGDFDGDGVDTVSFFNDGKWFIDRNGDGYADVNTTLGKQGDKPIAGDWDGDGIDGIGIVRDTGAGNADASTDSDFISTSSSDPDQQVGDLAMN